MPLLIFLDESGDLGWRFDLPYRYGGSSRFVTIAAACVDSSRSFVFRRVIRRLYSRFGWDTKREKKWAQMAPDERLAFADMAARLSNKEPSVSYHSITTFKPRVQAHIRRDPNKLYNYMIRLMLVERMSQHEEVIFKPDPRSVKVASGNSLHDYLQTHLWFDLKTATDLRTVPEESSVSESVQFADMLSGVIQGLHEDNNTRPFRTLIRHFDQRRLYF